MRVVESKGEGAVGWWVGGGVLVEWALGEGVEGVEGWVVIKTPPSDTPPAPLLLPLPRQGMAIAEQYLPIIGSNI